MIRCGSVLVEVYISGTRSVALCSVVLFCQSKHVAGEEKEEEGTLKHPEQESLYLEVFCCCCC